MLEYVNKEEYKELLGTNSVPANFDNLVKEASSFINRQTMGRIDSSDVSKPVKYATCLIIDLLDEQTIQLSKIGNLKSEDIEGWKKTFATPEEIKSDYSNKMQTVLENYLCDEIGVDGNPLLYRGVC